MPISRNPIPIKSQAYPWNMSRPPPEFKRPASEFSIEDIVSVSFENACCKSFSESP